MEQSEKRDNLRAYLSAACEWAKNEKDRLEKEWKLGKNTEVHTLHVTKCLRIVTLLYQKVNVFWGSNCEFSGEIFRLGFERVNINAAGSYFLGPDHLTLDGMSDCSGAWRKNIYIDDVDNKLQLSLDREEILSKDLLF